MEKMKILLFANTSWYLYNFRRNLACELAKKGAKVFMVAPRDSFSGEFAGLPVEYVPIDMQQTGTNPLREAVVVGKLYRLMRSIRPDAVLSFTVKCNLYTGLCRRLSGFCHIANISGLGEVFDAKGALYRAVCLLYKVALKKVDTCFFQNQEDLKRLTGIGIVPPERSRRIPGSGVDLMRFTPGVPVPQSQDKRVFLMYGRIVPQKGYDVYLDAASRLKERYGDRIECRILGMVDKERPESQRLFERIRDYNERGFVVYHPADADVVPHVSSADIVVLPSRYNEGVPRTLLEAVACGKPVITTDWKGCRDVVDDGVNGLLVPVQDSGALEEAMSQCLDMPSEKLAAMGTAGRGKAEREFDERFVIRAYCGVVGLKQ